MYGLNKMVQGEKRRHHKTPLHVLVTRVNQDKGTVKNPSAVMFRSINARSCSVSKFVSALKMTNEDT